MNIGLESSNVVPSGSRLGGECLQDVLTWEKEHLDLTKPGCMLLQQSGKRPACIQTLLCTAISENSTEFASGSPTTFHSRCGLASRF